MTIESSSEVEIQDDTQEVVVETPGIETEVDSTDVETETEENDSDDENDSEDSEDKTEDEEVKPKKSGFKKRLDRAKRKLTDAQKETEYWKQEALKKQNQTKSEEVNETEKTASDRKPNADDFDSQDEYIEALTDWKLDSKLKDRDEKTQKETVNIAQQKKAGEWESRVHAFMDETDDFEEVLEDASDIKLSRGATEAIFDSEVGPAILYHLGKNQEEALRINKLSRVAAIREIGKIEAKLQTSNKKTTTKKTTNTPKPISPNRGSGKVSKDINDPNLSFAEYEALRNKQSA